MILDDPLLPVQVPAAAKGVVTTPTSGISASLKSAVDAVLAQTPPGHGTLVGHVVSSQGGAKEAQMVIAQRVSEDTWVATWIGKDFNKPGVSWGVQGAISW